LQEYEEESVKMVKARVKECIREIKEKYPDKKVLVVTHEGIIRLMYARGGILQVMHALYALFTQQKGPVISPGTLHTFNI